MPDASTDHVAREAARLIVTGRVDDVGPAIRRAAEQLGLTGIAMPGHGRVRKHVEAMTWQAEGREAARQRVLDVWRMADELMTAIDTEFPDAEPRLLGRGARGQIDGRVVLFVRIHTRASAGRIAEALEVFGYATPSFETADTRFGRFDRLRLYEPEGEIVLTRCLPEMLWKASEDLFHRRPIEAISLEELRARIEAFEVG